MMSPLPRAAPLVLTSVILACAAAACSSSASSDAAASGGDNAVAGSVSVATAGATAAAAGFSSGRAGSQPAAGGAMSGGGETAAAGQSAGDPAGMPGAGAAGSSGSAGADAANAGGAGHPTSTTGGQPGTAGGPPITELFNGTDLSGFDVYRQNAEQAPGTKLSAAQALSIFKPENGAIHVYADAPDQSAQVHYTLVTTQSYGKYKLWWEYRWGTKKFAPYTDLAKYPRDAGVLWHIHGDVSQLWPASMEFQNKVGSTGDIFALYARCTAPGSASNKAVFAEGGGAVLVDGSNGFVQHGRSANFEVADGWTPLLMEVHGGTAVYSVNGHVVNRVLSVTDKSGQPVTAGPIAWQAEQAEVFYRNLRIQVLP